MVGGGSFPFETELFLSESSGASWRAATQDPPTIFALAADPDVRHRLLAGAFEGLFVSEDGGRRWRPFGSGLPEGAAIHQLLRHPRFDTWYAATLDRGIFRSLDGGASWTRLEGAPDHHAPRIAIDPRRPEALLAAFRGQSLWRWAP